MRPLSVKTVRGFAFVVQKYKSVEMILQSPGAIVKARPLSAFHLRY